MRTKKQPLVSVNPQFQRSIRIDVDFDRADALESYLCQAGPLQALEIVANHVAGSQQRAFTWTGPYGGGKSSLALALAQLAGGSSRSRHVAQAALQRRSKVVSKLFCTKRPWLVLPVVGSRAPIDVAIGESIDKRAAKPGPKPKRDGRRDVIGELVRRAEANEHAGILLVLDELGKFLQGAVARDADVHFFQELAEAASRCSGNLVVVGILHQSFDQYAARLNREARDEWAKVQGRYVDIPLVTGTDEVIQLIGNAITCEAQHQDSRHTATIVAKSIQERRPGSSRSLDQDLDRCWPLHPVTAALLGPSSRRRFGQNERSVFGFLGSAEPYGFQEFIQSFDGAGTYDPAAFWDYLRANFEPAILASPDGHRWALVADAVERAEARYGALHVKLIKSAGLIELFKNGSGLSGSSDVLATCVSAPAGEVEAALEELSRASILVFRKHIQSWCVFAGSDFDIEAALASARQVTGAAIETQLRSLAMLPPLTARKHYSETGTLRWFDREVVLAETVTDGLGTSPPSGRAGRFVLLLPSRNCPAGDAAQLAKDLSKRHTDSLTVVGVPSESLALAHMAAELAALEYISENHRPLHGDAVARREVDARTQEIRLALEEALREGFNLARWYVDGHVIRKSNGLSRIASDLCDSVYHLAPIVHSELVNRNELSSNAAKAQRRLLHHMVQFGDSRNLGFEGYPAEAGLYYTTIAALGLHRVKKSVAGFVTPGSTRAADSNRIGNLWRAFQEELSDADGQVSLVSLYELAQNAPFGVKEGLLPILSLAYFLSNRSELGLYIEGAFVSEISTSVVDEWLQDPSRITFKSSPMDAAAKQLLSSLAERLSALTNREIAAEPLDTARALVSIATQLPGWTRRTQQLSQLARDVRSALLRASDPLKVIFIDLPHLLQTQSDSVALADVMSSVIEELQAAYPAVLHALETQTLQAIDHAGDFSAVRERASQVRGTTGDFRLDAFAGRMESYRGTLEDQEGLVSLAASKPPTEFTDHDLEAARLQLTKWAFEFRRVEAMNAVGKRDGARHVLALVFGARSTLSATIDVAERDSDLVRRLANEIVSHATSKGVKQDLLLAALAEIGSALLAAREPEEVT